MRLAWVILALAAIGAATVYFRCEQDRARCQMYRLDARRLQIRRSLWQQQIRLGELPVGGRVYRRLPEWPLELVAPGESVLSGEALVRRAR